MAFHMHFTDIFCVKAFPASGPTTGECGLSVFPTVWHVFHFRQEPPSSFKMNEVKCALEGEQGSPRTVLDVWKPKRLNLGGSSNSLQNVDLEKGSWHAYLQS